MKQNLLNTIFLSEKRKRLLLLLEDSPRNMEEIIENINTPRQGILPQIKILYEQKLILKNKNIIKLTKLGELLVSEMKPIVRTIDILEEDYEYWATRDLTAIPKQLFMRIGDLCPCRIIEPELNEMFDLSPEVLEGMKRSEYVLACASFIYPSYPPTFQELDKEGKETSVILTENAFMKLEKDFRDAHEGYLSSDRSGMYLVNELNMPGLLVTDNFTLLWLFNDRKDFEPVYIISNSKSAINWGKEFFEHYRNNAEKVDGLLYSE